ncbi:MAG: CHRD domain-containing protein [Ferruginibacter sp.]
MKNTFRFLPLLLFIFLNSCLKDEENTIAPISQSYVAQLAGTNAIPSNASSANGILNGIYNSNAQTFNFTLNYTGINPASWNIHQGAAGENGPILFALGNVTPSPYTRSITLSVAQLAALNAGLLYINIVSAGFPDGEIRGQIIK